MRSLISFLKLAKVSGKLYGITAEIKFTNYNPNGSIAGEGSGQTSITVTRPISGITVRSDGINTYFYLAVTAANGAIGKAYLGWGDISHLGIRTINTINWLNIYRLDGTSQTNDISEGGTKQGEPTGGTTTIIVQGTQPINNTTNTTNVTNVTNTITTPTPASSPVTNNVPNPVNVNQPDPKPTDIIQPNPNIVPGNYPVGSPTTNDGTAPAPIPEPVNVPVPVSSTQPINNTTSGSNTIAIAAGGIAAGLGAIAGLGLPGVETTNPLNLPLDNAPLEKVFTDPIVDPVEDKFRDLEGKPPLSEDREPIPDDEKEEQAPFDPCKANNNMCATSIKDEVKGLQKTLGDDFDDILKSALGDFANRLLLDNI